MDGLRQDLVYAMRSLGRAPKFAAAVILIGPCTIYYKIWKTHRHMPLLLGLVLVALFIWFAENIGTFTAAWAYPHQRHGWQLVGIGKLGSWFLLMLISYTLVAAINRPQPMSPADDQDTESLPQ